MLQQVGKKDIIKQLQREVITLQGFKRADNLDTDHLRFGPIIKSFPQQSFPLGAIHELISYQPESAVATNAFVCGLVGLMSNPGAISVWVSTRRTIFPAGLKAFGIDPERIIFIDLKRPKEALWTIEEALKCDMLTSVIAEISELSFTESRRLQLAVEQSKVSGFIHRYRPRSENTVACMTRWKITPLSSKTTDGLPGVGFPRWNIELTKVRNGKPGSWQVEWSPQGLRYINDQAMIIGAVTHRKAV
jgi:protein ImuA